MNIVKYLLNACREYLGNWAKTYLLLLKLYCFRFDNYFMILPYLK